MYLSPYPMTAKFPQESLMRNFVESFLEVPVDYVSWITLSHTLVDTLKELQKVQGAAECLLCMQKFPEGSRRWDRLGISKCGWSTSPFSILQNRARAADWAFRLPGEPDATASFPGLRLCSAGAGASAPGPPSADAVAGGRFRRDRRAALLLDQAPGSPAGPASCFRPTVAHHQRPLGSPHRQEMASPLRPGSCFVEPFSRGWKWSPNQASRGCPEPNPPEWRPVPAEEKRGLVA
ncbi:uncharacterized protein LOC128337206 isoform X2 [Hemicordylus capensis]|uniref:uncharacterized protein LOC128337206 isoform X2 n=1 Tax=Hemicordylus capensis TaxID=884348 RepID=UPI0023045D13|nr:uncharacterized protein LOC128337206 isoform X2 [Hemicordylus capensis]